MYTNTNVTTTAFAGVNAGRTSMEHPRRSSPASRRSRSRSRSPDAAASGPAGHPACPEALHCPTCTLGYSHEALKPREHGHGCCGTGHCPVDEPGWAGAVLIPISGSTPAAWRFVGYRLAFRYIEGIGRRGVRVPHPVCVLRAVREYVDANFEAESE